LVDPFRGSAHHGKTDPRSILDSSPKNKKKNPLTASQAMELVLQFGGGNPGKLQTVSLGFTAFLHWDHLKDLRRHDLHMSSDHTCMSIMLTKRKNVQFREGSVILLAGTGSHTCTCPVSFTERFLFVGQYKESDYLFRKICHNRHGFSFFPNSGLAQMPPSCLKSNSKSLGSTTSNMAYTVSGRAEHPLQQLLLSQTGS